MNNLIYDKNGNILSMKRLSWLGDTHWQTIDRLKYFYEGNRLIGVNDTVKCGDSQNPIHPTELKGEQSRQEDFCDNGYRYNPDADSPPEFEYDASGNMISDLNRSIRISYNSGTNLPNEIIHPQGVIRNYVFWGLSRKKRRTLILFPQNAS